MLKAWPDQNLDVVAEPMSTLAAARRANTSPDVPGTEPQLRPRHVQERSCLVGRQPSMLREPINPNRQIGLCEFDVRLAKAQVREHVACARRQNEATHI